MIQKEIIQSRIKIGQLLKSKRLQNNLTKMDLAKLTGLTRPTIDAIENANKSYNIDSYIIYLEGVK